MKFPVYPESASREALQSLPRLTMDEYVEFVEANMLLIDPEKARRQKELEENIQVMFSLRDSSIAAPSRNTAPRSSSAGSK